MRRSPLTLFLVLWACLALPLQGFAYYTTVHPTTPSHHGVANEGTHTAHFASHGADLQAHPCCPVSNDADCPHGVTHGAGCAASCAGTTNVLTGSSEALPPARLTHGFDLSSLIGLLAPAHGSNPLRPPA